MDTSTADSTIDLVPAGPNTWTVSPKYTHGGGLTLTYEPENASEGATICIRRHGMVVYGSNRLSDIRSSLGCKLGIW